MALAPDGDEELIEVPCITQPTLSPLDCTSVIGTEFQAPLADGFIRDCDAPLGEQVLNISEAQAEPVLQPDCMTYYH